MNAPGTTISGITAPISQGGKQEYTVTATGCALNTALNVRYDLNVIVTFTPGYPGTRPVPLLVATSAGTFTFGMFGIGTAPQVALWPGIVSTAATNLINTDDYFLNGGAVLDSAGNIYTVLSSEDLEGNEIVEFAAGTNVETVVLAANNLTGQGDPEAPLNLALDGAGNLYIKTFIRPLYFEGAPGSGNLPSWPAVSTGEVNGLASLAYRR